MAPQSIYIYGIVDGHCTKTFPNLGIGNWEDQASIPSINNDVFSVPFKDITAIVSHTPFEEYDPTEENTLLHEGVIQEVLKNDFTIAPMRFCTIVRTRNDLLKLLHSGYMAFRRNLLKIKNKQEFDVKVFLDTEQLQKEVNDGEELLTKSQEIATLLYGLLENVTEEAVLSDQVTREMILNASFLVRNEEREVFHQEIVNFDKKYNDQIKIRISGPTAPYNFVVMPVK
jgi:hypothetical protein